jgi:hypothetical protein
MTQGKSFWKAMPLLIGGAVLLSACAADPGYNSSAVAYGYPTYVYPEYEYPSYGFFDFDYWGGGDWHRHWDRDDHGWHDGHR